MLIKFKFKIWHIMAATAVIGALLGLCLHNPDFIPVFVSLLVLGAVSGFAYLTISGMTLLSLKSRLAIEISTIFVLLAISAVLWTPPFYAGRRHECERMARLALEATSDSPEMRAALDAEAAWFTRKAAALRWRGLWLGLTMGPLTDNVVSMSRADIGYELGVIESMDLHTTNLRKYCPPKAFFP